MGFDKALLSLGRQPVAQMLAARLRELTDQVFLSTNDPSVYSFLGLPAIADAYPGRGPLAGLHAAMLHTSRFWVLVLACDLPGVSTILLRRLIESSSDFDAVIPVTSDGRMHPVCALYSRNCLGLVEKYLGAGENRMINLLENPKLRVLRITAAEGFFSDAELHDVNSLQDYEEYLRLSEP